MKATLKKGPWGKYASLEESGNKIEGIRDEAYLSYDGKHTDYPAGKIYAIELFFTITYPKAPDKDGKNWTTIEGKSVGEVLAKTSDSMEEELRGRIEELRRRKERDENIKELEECVRGYYRDYLNKKRVVPYFTINTPFRQSSYS